MQGRPWELARKVAQIHRPTVCQTNEQDRQRREPRLAQGEVRGRRVFIRGARRNLSIARILRVEDVARVLNSNPFCLSIQVRRVLWSETESMIHRPSAESKIVY